MTCALASLLFWESLFDHHAAALIEQLGDDQFLAREAANAALVRMVRSDEGYVLLLRLEAATRHRDPEIAVRAEGILAEFYNVRPAASVQVPWIDMLPQSVRNRDALIKQYRQLGHEAGCPCNAPRWYDYRYATSLYVRDMLRSGQPRSHVQKLLDEMATAEKTYKTNNRLPDDY
jgi:hypothetical protein